MSLPEVLKHVYHNATDEVIRRGKKIFHTGGVQLLENDPLVEEIVFKVRNDVYYNHYKVIVEKYSEYKTIATRCQCPYNMGNVCRHEAAALFQLNELLQTGYFDNVQIEYDQKHTLIRMRQITTHFLKLFSSQAIFNDAANIVSANGISILEGKNDTVKAMVIDKHEKEYPVILKQNEERFFDTSCECNESKHPLCVHKAAVFLQLFHSHGSHYFATIRDWDAEKNRLLAQYGFSLSDNLTGKFEFAYHDGKPFLRVMDPKIKKIEFQSTGVAAKEEEVAPKNYRMGVVVQAKGEYFPYTDFNLISGIIDEKETKFKGKIEVLDPNQYIAPNTLTDRDKVLVTALRRQSSEDLMKSLKRNSPFGELWMSLPRELKEGPNEEVKKQVWEFYLPRYKNIAKQFDDFLFVYYLDKDKNCVTKNIKDLKFTTDSFRTFIKAKYLPEQNSVSLNIDFEIIEDKFTFEQVTVINSAILIVKDQFFTADNLDEVAAMELFQGKGERIIPMEEWADFLENTILPLTTVTQIEFDDSLVINKEEEDPDLRLYLKETDKMMVFKPIFAYNNIEKEWLDYTPITSAKDGKIIIQKRDEASEQTFLTFLRHFHESMQESRKTVSFMLPAKEALKGNWYFQFMDKLREFNVEVFGYENLKELKVNPHKPVTKLQVSSGIDWFDTVMNVSFGDESVKLEDIRKALMKRENFIKLKDGSLGLFPQEWLDKYALMLKLGTLKGNNSIRVSNFHFSVIENFKEDIENQEILEELDKKRERLMSFDFDNQNTIPIPENVYATLRPYQIAGFQWMNFLKETGWGGILADDMGLGKTLQTLTFLQHCLNENPGSKFMMACPTTLIYNWENELNKYTPDITYRIHHGPQRTKDLKVFEEVNLIITTYGTLRSDIKMLSTIDFDYVVLDESQTIKNPLSQVAKASLELKSKNRIALSGTPVQNNTFDLYSQMNFLNPGMLGTMDFFRNEFANPIDKMQEKDAKENLRKIINPFLLRRTKEQVAPDLPEKTEMIHFCEMGTKQRKIYDTYRNSFRTKILDEIEQKGIERSQFSVLTGLMKLRQICDSPAILNSEEPYENHSVKITELVKGLTENTGNHKSLVFSQFLGMLKLIREELDALGIPYVYFDGGTTSTDREKAIQEFQNNEECRVFLISLKAGGVGLNLTAADYVYIVDPWWNPAVEQQAIDRTHRIGQTKKIFAYRMICKETIEEKILILQERKLALVKDLISDENAFLKKLTKEDIEYILS